jgi:hypothetical protein
MHKRGCPRDFAAHAQQLAKPKFAPAGRRESGRYSDQERRTSQPAGEAKQLPCRRWLEYTGKSRLNATPVYAAFWAGSRVATRLPAMVDATPATTSAAPAYCNGDGRSCANHEPSSKATKGLT